MAKPNNILQTERQLSKIGDAVGVDKKKWFVAIVNNNTELSSARKLENLGFETFVPIQEIISDFNGKRRKRKKVVISMLLFVHVSEQERRQIVNLPFVKRFMTNVSGQKDSFGKHPIATIPDEQMEQLIKLLQHSESEVFIESLPKSIGEEVTICGGPLNGLTGHVVQMSQQKQCFIIQISCLGCAKIHITHDMTMNKK